MRYLWTKIKNIFVAKESGKGLSTNDFTAAYKQKLDGIANNANNYSLPTASSSTLGGIKVGSGLSISNGVLSASGGLQVQKVTGRVGYNRNDTQYITFSFASKLVIFMDAYGSLAGIMTPGDSIEVVYSTSSINVGIDFTLNSDGTSISYFNDESLWSNSYTVYALG